MIVFSTILALACMCYLNGDLMILVFMLFEVCVVEWHVSGTLNQWIVIMHSRTG